MKPRPHRSSRPFRPDPSASPAHSKGGPRSERPERPDEPRGRFIARGVRLIHEDDDVIIVEKPSGMVTADPSRAAPPGSGARPSAREGDTLFDYVKNHVRSDIAVRKARRRNDDEGRRSQPGRVWVIHRLDKEASGLLVFAKSERAFDALKEQFRTKAAHRIYLAVAEGEVGPVGSTGTRNSMIYEDRGPGPRGNGEKGARGPRDHEDDGKRPAVTHWQVVGAGNGCSLLRVRLETGRKNQIRIHMQELGHSLVGDRRFGAKTNPIDRLGLHAAELGFEHPGSNASVRYTSPAPPSFYKCVGQKPPSPHAHERAAPDATDAPAAGAKHDTSWNEVAGWYDTLLEDRGSDHYEQVILPGVTELLGVRPGQRILDVACGQGILARRLASQGAKVTGVDAAPKLIEAAKTRSPDIDFHVGDARDLAALKLHDFDAAACVMALSNIDPLEPALRGIAASLKPGGVLVAAIVHPAFRVPGQSDWAWDEKTGKQFRRVDAYLTPFRKEMKMHPGKAAQGKRGGEIVTPTFHRPIGEYVRALAAAGLLVTDMREWISRREATSGPRAPEENRSRVEIPLFLGIRAMKTRPAD
jgi:23S rRNA-/tRNA-specific pseudouridylate synthase/2-polyprenyl-3-methyl-5-hydroxy-6-metoxy-1,4-benzoquinol methylase